MKKIPAALIALRALCGPVLLLAQAAGASGLTLAGLVTVAFVSDVLDGMVARRLGVATEALRAADSVVDAVFYVCAVVTLALRAWPVVRAYDVGIAVLIALELARWAVERLKYGRIAAYHMWSAKAWGITLWLGFSEAFVLGRPGPFLLSAVVLGILADMEGLGASLVLSRWHHDVPTLWHAIKIERSAIQPMTPARLTVRRAVLGDEPILRALRLEALADAPETFGSTYERELARTTADWQRWLAPGVTLILEDSKAARGLVAGMHDAQDSRIVHLMAMWVHPSVRGSGAADSLVKEHLAWGRTVGARFVQLDVFETNPRARRLYERHGFRLTGQQTVRDDGRLELRMELAL
jgi:CDP-diacylglycerol--glycerol-3-phosphate 3-phosphatidyltransferase